MSRTFFTSDLHIGHAFVSRLRGFATPNEHDAAIATTWSEHIGPEDSVWILGDLSLHQGLGLSWLSRVPGTKHLVTGNHDDCWPGSREGHTHQRAYLEQFASVQPFARRRIAGRTVLLSHFPYTADRDDEARALQFRLPDLGHPLLHGHLHTREVWTSARELHVGWDAWQRPVCLTEIEALVATIPDGGARAAAGLYS